MFEPLPQKFSFPDAERRILEFWETHKIFQKTLEQRAGAPRFVFYEGPPTANGMPHPGHCLTRAIKDIFPRYRTMTGHLVERKAGWDTHGLPVEREVEKELGLQGKADIEKYGVEKFIHKCISSVWRYTREWEEMTKRLGFWVNLEEAYATYHQSYVESVWWSLKTLFERGLLYQAHKVVWWWCQGGTALSAGEVGEGYRPVDDPSVFVKFPLVDATAAKAGSMGVPPVRPEAETVGQGSHGPEAHAPPRTSLLVWTTTPWTLISNHFAAVHPDLEYALVHDEKENEYLYIAAALVETIAKKVKRELKVVATCKGAELIGNHYVPPFDVYYKKRILALESGWGVKPPDSASSSGGSVEMGRKLITRKNGGKDTIGWRVLAADFVTLDSGTGLVHEAPAFGEVDFNLLQKERGEFIKSDNIPVLCAVAPDGTFTDDAPEKYRGRWIKDCDKDIIRELKERGLLYHQEQYRHDYPFCPRAENDPLIQYARKSWFVRTSQFKEEFLKNNEKINWLPDHIKEGRFGDFLRNNVDWALSRERFWGTPLPIWVCEKTGKMEAVGSFAELKSKPGATDGGFWEKKVAEHHAAGDPPLPEHLRVHKPYVDAWIYESPFVSDEDYARMIRDHEEAVKLVGDEAGKLGYKSDANWPPAPPQRPRMRRVPEVIDCWWDAGSMPFAQWGFPHQPNSIETFTQRFPADFISEAIDQTRGWFYGLLAISTLLFSKATEDQTARQQVANLSEAERERLQKAGLLQFIESAPPPQTVAEENLPPFLKEMFNAIDYGTHTSLVDGKEQFVSHTAPYPLPYRTCIVLGFMLGEDGNKMSKRLRNYREPSYVFDQYGADAMRWYFFSAQAPWTTTRFTEANIRDSQREFLVKLYHVLSFFNIYANIDGFEPRPVPECGHRPTAQRGELDRWIISELQRTIRDVRAAMDRFENFPAAKRLSEFVEALSNWYVRRSRDRFWRGEKNQDKWDAYHTLYGCLWTVSQLLAPFTPFFAETMYQNLVSPNLGATAGADQSKIQNPKSKMPLSVHLCDYPVADEALIDESLSTEMDLVREIASLGRAARAASSVKEAKKVRQPLPRVEIVLAKPEYHDWLADHAPLIAEELNVKAVEFAAEADHYVSYKVVPNFPAIGKKYRALVPGIKAALGALTDPAAARKALVSEGALSLTVDGQTVQLTPEEVEIRLEARPGWSAAPGRVGVVVVQTELTPDLLDEGIMRELVHHVQSFRKEQELPYEARIALFVKGPEKLLAVVRKFDETIRRECLAERVEFAELSGGAMQKVDIEGLETFLAIQRV